MGRRTWIKIFSDKWLRGSIRQETLQVRAIWIDLLTLAADSVYGDEGVISIAPKCGLSDQQISAIFNIDIKLWKKAKQRLINTDRITVNGHNEIDIVNWKKYQAEYERQKPYRRASPESRINYSMGVAIANSLTKKKDGLTWEKAVGYTRKDLVMHLEALFQKGMTWGNYGKWHMDHIIPKSKFRFKSIDDIGFKECWSLKNLQPLWAQDNLSKGDKLGLQVEVTNGGDKQKREERREKREEKEIKHICVEIFSFWKEHLNHPKALLTEDRRTKIGARLKEGYTLDQSKDAIRGCKLSAYHMGDNPQGKVYDTIELIFRNGDKIEQFINIYKEVLKHGKTGKRGKRDTKAGWEESEKYRHLYRK